MALVFDVATDTLYLGAGRPPIASFTMMAWFYLDADRNQYNTMFSYGTDLSVDAYYAGTAADGITFEIEVNGGPVATGPAVTVATWTHAAMTVAGTGAGQFLGYVNGVLVATAAGSPTTTVGPMLWGNDTTDGSGPDYWSGRLAAGKAWVVPLSAAEIRQEMRYYLPLRTAGLHSVYPWLNLTSPETDYSGLGHTLTLGGTLTTAPGPPIAWAPRPVSLFDRQPVARKAPPPRRQPWRRWRRVA